MSDRNEIRRQLSGMPTGEYRMQDMQFSVRRPMQEDRDRQKLLEAYRRAGVATEAYVKTWVAGIYAKMFDPATGKVMMVGLIPDSDDGEP